MDFAQCLSLTPLTDDELCSGFGGCNSSGLQATSDNLNRAFAYLQSVAKAGTNENLTLNLTGNILELRDGATVLASVTLPSGDVPATRVINATVPLEIDGGASADLTADRTLSIDMAALSTALNATFATDSDVTTAISNYATANQPRAGSFTVTANATGSVVFATPFPSGIVPHIAFADYGNRNGGDEADEELFVTARSETGFSWSSAGDGPNYTVGYVAAAAF
jgi:hypothetical protein